MALLPLVLPDMDDFYYDPWNNYRKVVPSGRPRRSWLDDFGFGIHPNDLDEMLAMPKEFRQIEQRARELQRQTAGTASELAPSVGKDGFQVCVDVQQFKPNEVSVKTDGNHITIEGKHEERQDQHGYISRQFTRRYALPKGFDPNAVTSELSSDGVLTVKAPPPVNALEGNERKVKIEHTGPARLNVKGDKSIEEKK